MSLVHMKITYLYSKNLLHHSTNNEVQKVGERHCGKNLMVDLSWDHSWFDEDFEELMSVLDMKKLYCIQNYWFHTLPMTKYKKTEISIVVRT